MGEYPDLDILRGPNHFGPGGDFDLSRKETQGLSPSGAGRTHTVQKYVPGTREGESDVQKYVPRTGEGESEVQKYVPGTGEGGSDVQKYVPKSDIGAHFEGHSGSYSGDVRMEEQSHNTELENFMEASNKNDKEQSHNTELENYMEESNKNDLKVERYGEGNIH